MCENEKFTEMPGRKRLEFGAVPLKPWTAVYPGASGESYAQASLRHIHERLDANIHIPIENGSIGSEEELRAIYKFCDLSLADAHMRRINHHFVNGVEQPVDDENGTLQSKEKLIDGDPEVVEAVLGGTATPIEMLQTLVINPHLEAIELAKLSHPFDSQADQAMLEAVDEALMSLPRATLPMEFLRYKVKRVDRSVPALTVLQKRLLTTLDTGTELIDIIVRKSFMVRGNPRALSHENQPPIDRLVHKIDRDKSRESLFKLVDQAAVTSDTLDQTPWLDILTTSVYASYRKPSED